MLDQTPEHIVALGMTGSGKTGLALGLLEDVALAGTPLVLVDLKGDLVNLAMVPRDLTPAAFRPYATDDAEAARTAGASLKKGSAKRCSAPGTTRSTSASSRPAPKAASP